jgi:hypothetical protein
MGCTAAGCPRLPSVPSNSLQDTQLTSFTAFSVYACADEDDEAWAVQQRSGRTTDAQVTLQVYGKAQPTHCECLALVPALLQMKLTRHGLSSSAAGAPQTPYCHAQAASPPSA